MMQARMVAAVMGDDEGERERIREEEGEDERDRRERMRETREREGERQEGERETGGREREDEGERESLKVGSHLVHRTVAGGKRKMDRKRLKDKERKRQ